MKAAAALALLHGEREVTGQFWDMSEALMAMSQATRASVEAQLAEKGRSANRARGQAEGERAVVAEEVSEDAAIKRVAQTILRWLEKHGEGTYAEVRKDSVASEDRKYFDDALDRLVQAGSVEVVDDEIKLAAQVLAGFGAKSWRNRGGSPPPPTVHAPKPNEEFVVYMVFCPRARCFWRSAWRFSTFLHFFRS